MPTTRVGEKTTAKCVTLNIIDSITHPYVDNNLKKTFSFLIIFCCNKVTFQKLFKGFKFELEIL